MRKFHLACSLSLALLTAATSTRAQGPAFALKDGDTVVMYGDSITAQALYTQFAELYTATRFPGLHIRFVGAGVGGDRVSGGYGGSVDGRLARDVFPFKPTVMTIMLGMNDAAYQASSPAIETAYTTGYEHLLGSIRTHAPGVRLTLIGPSAYDDISRPPWIPGGYNGVLRHYADLDQSLARKFDGSFVNFNAPVVAVLEKAQAFDPIAAQLLIPDRIHPDTIVHWVMAETLLKGWNAPALVSSVAIDARAGKDIETKNTSVKTIEREKDSLSWNETDAALPLPFNPDNATHALLIRLTDIEQQLNQETLRVAALEPGHYELTIDTATVGTFSAAELGTGINLTLYKTPMRDQAQSVAYLVSDRDTARSLQMRMLIDKADTGARDGKPDLLEAFESLKEEQIHAAAAPKPHHYQLIRVDAVP
jgi:lysophospholipase L1-like esterase